MPFFLNKKILIILIEALVHGTVWTIRLARVKSMFETQRGTGKNPSRPASFPDLFYFPVYLSISKHFSWEQDIPFLLTLAILLPSSSFSQNSQLLSVNGFHSLSAEPWVREIHACCLLLKYPRYCCRQWHVKILPVLDWDQKQWFIVLTHYPFYLTCLAGCRNNSLTFFHLV